MTRHDRWIENSISRHYSMKAYLERMVEREELEEEENRLAYEEELRSYEDD